jgi:3-phenylpropionate/trans-cinnamate dioxygenase ferredoxin reductase subunit
MERVVIVGAGQAGYQVAASLRDGGFEGSLLLIGDEESLPYQRPPLSKDFMHGKVEAAGLHIRQPAFFADKRIEILTPARVEKIDRARHSLRLGTGADVAYDHLVLATGTRNRLLSVPGTDQRGVFYLRSLAEAQLLRNHLGNAKSAVVIGGGFIGLEFAAVARALGLAVTVVEAGSRLMARAVAPETSAFYKAQHESWGSQFFMETGVAEIEGTADGAHAVVLSNGRRLMADLVLIGIGVVPNVELAADAGLAVKDGIVVDELLATADPSISAIGDCANHPNDFAFVPTTLRLESIQNATDQARCVAARLLGKPRPYKSVPWFWSDQGESKLQIVGLPPEGGEHIVKGDIAAGSFSVFRFAGDKLAAIDSVNRTADHMAGRKLLQNAMPLTPDRVADPSFDLKAFVMGQRTAA